LTSTIEYLRTMLSTFNTRLVTALGFMVLVLGLIYNVTHPAHDMANSDQWLPVQPQLLENHFGLVGRIEAATRKTFSAPFDGLIQHIAVTEGQRVEHGQLLLKLDTTQLDIQLRQALTELLKAKHAVQSMQDWAHSEDVTRTRRALATIELNLTDTETKLADTQRLFERGIVPRMEVEALEQQLRLLRLDFFASQADLHAVETRGQGDNRKIAEMELANAKARYDSLLNLHAQRELHAPFAGIILRPQKNDSPSTAVAIHVGQHVAQGAPLLELASLEHINATSRIEESDLHQLQEGMPVQVTSDGFNDVILNGQISNIGAQAIAADMFSGGSYYDVIVAIDPLTLEQQNRIKIGMSARLTVVTYRAKSALAIPAEALQSDEDGTVYVMYRENLDKAPHKVAVIPGRTVLEGVQISGMKPGFVKLPAQQ